MSQESIYSQGRYRGGASSRSETNRSRSSTISTISKHENYNTSLISSPSQDHDSTHPKAELPSAESTSLLGSVWNLVRDAKELAAREVDKLLESFPYRSISKASTASQSGIHDKIKTRESSLAVKKPRVGSSSEPPKSLLGRGPPVKVRGQHSSHIKKNHALSRKLLSSDVKDHVNDVSPSVHLRTPLPMSKRVSGISSSIEPIKRMRHSSEFEFELESSPERSPPMQYRRTPSLKRDLSESSLSSIQAGQGTIHDSDWTSSEERRRQEHIDHSEYTAKKHDRDTESSPRPNSSPTPSITSMARSLSIVSHSHAHTDLPHRPHSRQRLHAPHRRRPHYVHHQRHNSNTSPVRNSLLGGPLEATSSHDDFIEPVPAPVAIYPSSPSISREGSAIEGKIDSMPMLSSTSTTVGSMNNPFVVTKGLSPLPPSLLADTTPERTSGSPKISSTPDNDKLQELQHELALIKEQVYGG
ncbi:hypothetical protein BX616_000476 [Lobosporangium transversale]|uniref:Uncharacterized protein n=1 Tax=Lobosporangium transversale TaxID=64571 RepID=A0A1Y2G7T8_9FUNG|nr:hypothetical protein BCR41DRAFT_227795 [Lobosporangium transversale]KAF9907286.1 hypothetical protein BX616_000476 [Lobosporangium transversale]ORY98288.1 hypothetical protein BCR41DRAFT_227795 [Lobosporangium transversale]|eukprot:XP_021875717.1 hypothetical protein BCR41DRAFT_227795 [Lobosporangium transversale]